MGAFEQPQPERTIGPALATARARRAARRQRGRFLAILLAILVTVAALAGTVTGLQLRRQGDALQALLGGEATLGANELQQGKDLVSKANTDNNPALLAEASQHFARSRAHFQRADQVARTDPLVRRLQATPGLGPAYVAPRVRSVRAIAAMGVALADAGQDAADVDALLIKPPDSQARGGERLIAVLKAAQGGTVKIKADLQRADRQAAQVDAALLSSSQQSSFRSARDSISKGLAGIKEFERLSPVLLEIMGDNGPRTYLVEQVDPAELRAGGGFIGSYTTLHADKGNLTLGLGFNVYDIDCRPAVPTSPCLYPSLADSPAPAQLKKAFGHGLVFGDSNYSPDFAVSAQAGMATLLRQTQTRVDGVICLDPWAVATLLDVTGPIDVPEYGARVEASTFPEDVFQRLETEPANVPGKKTFFPVVAAKVIDRLSNLESDRWSKLIGNLNTAVTQRHLQVYFANQAAQEEMTYLGWTGSLSPARAGQEVFAEVEANYGGDKANHFLDRSYDVTMTAEGGKLRHRVAINYINRTPDGYLGGRHYLFYLRAYVPAGATDVKETGLQPSEYVPDENVAGLKVIDGWWEIGIVKGDSATHQVVLEYTTDAGNLASGHELYWRKQAGTGPDKVKITYHAGGKTHTVNTDLSQDRLLVMTPDTLQVKAGATAGAKLPLIGA